MYGRMESQILCPLAFGDNKRLGTIKQKDLRTEGRTGGRKANSITGIIPNSWTRIFFC